MRSTEEKIKRKVISVVIIVAILSTMAGCGKSQSRKEPITLTIWHVYGGQTDSPLNDLIDEFNGSGKITRSFYLISQNSASYE